MKLPISIPLSILLYIPLFVFINCQSNQEIKPANDEEKSQSQITVEIKRLKPSKKEFIQKASHVAYYEIPELSEIINPEELGTFSIRVNNLSHIDRFRNLTTSSDQEFYTTPPHNCKPSFNSALVFKFQNESETILFSRNCGLLYLYQEKLYADVKEQSTNIENTFRMIRSGR
ncbi:MAG: hypothetical protein JJT78_06570 [Leptospira sp.]|nr:hypothetical protein [Leptospira sp.]